MDINDLLDGEESLPKWKRKWFEEIEPHAMILRSYEMLVVPGLLQTRDYASVVLRGNEVEIEMRMERQEVLQKSDGPTLRVVLHEAALHVPLGGANMMREQLQRLVDVQSRKITIQVVTSDVNPNWSGAFTIAELAGERVGYVESVIRGMVTSDRDEVTKLADVWDGILAHALPVAQSIALIEKVAEGTWTPEN
jgi:hypothetical protein